MTLNALSADWLAGASLTICSTRSTTRLFRLFFVHDLLKPLCTRGRLPCVPRLGGCTTRHACSQLNSLVEVTHLTLHPLVRSIPTSHPTIHQVLCSLDSHRINTAQAVEILLFLTNMAPATDLNDPRPSAGPLH